MFGTLKLSIIVSIELDPDYKFPVTFAGRNVTSVFYSSNNNFNSGMAVQERHC